MADIKILPAWAEELRTRYLRGEASVFVLHGNVQDMILDQNSLISITDYLANSVLEKKDLVIRYNVSTGCRFNKKDLKVPDLDNLLFQRSPSTVLPTLEHLLFSQKNMAAIIEYAEMIAPEGSALFFSEQDRLAIVTLQRWSLAPQLDQGDNIVILFTEALNELHPKIISNPRVAAVKIPMPDYDLRRKTIEIINPILEKSWVDRLADVTAGLKVVQIKSILKPSEPDAEDASSRFRFIKSLIGDETRSRKLAALTHGMSHQEIQELVGVNAPLASPEASLAKEIEEVIRLISRRKREILERECFGLIEFVDPAHDFSMVGGIEEVKASLLTIARNIRKGKTSRVPMGLLFTGPMGTGKTFVAEAFVKESGLTGIKLKNFRSKWVGATEANLERILDVVRAIGNVIVIIDEGDRSFGSGEGGDSDGGTSSRVIARIKEFMSDSSNRGRVLFIVMTNRPDKLDIDIKRAGRLDQKIPFFFSQTAEDVEPVLLAQFRRHKLTTDLQFPRDREAISAQLVGFSNADLEAVVLLANTYASEAAEEEDKTITVEHFTRALADYLPSRDVEMLEYMELLAMFEASNRRLLPQKYMNVSLDELQRRLNSLRITCGTRR